MTKIDHHPRARSTATGITLAASALMAIGLVALASATSGVEHSFLHREFWKTLFGRQALFVLIAVVILLVTSRVGAHWLRWRVPPCIPAWQPSAWLLLLTVLLLVAVLIPGIGVERHGARRWLHFGPAQYGLGFQPSELAKLTLVVFLASFLAGRGQDIRRFFGGLLPAVLAVGLCAGLVGVEDFGTAVLLGAVGALLLVVAGARLWHLALLALPAAAAFGWMLLLKPYRMERLTGFLDIWQDPQGKGYHAVQSLIGISSGGWLGQGLGGSLQKYGYLPERSTDFIFSIWAEETGLLGCLVVLVLFAAILYLGMRVACAASSAFGRLLAAGVTMMITAQAVMNVAVVTVSVPTKGIALPLVSAGGSGIVFMSAAVGLLVSVARESKVECRTSNLQPSTFNLEPLT